MSSLKIDGKICPEDFTKPGLVKLTSKKLGVPPKQIQKLNKQSLCRSYESGQITTVSAKTKPAPKKKVAPKKKPAKKVKKPTAQPPKKEAQAKKPPPPKKRVNVVVSPYPDPEGPLKSPPPKVRPPKIVAKKACIEHSQMPLKEHQIRVVNHMRKNRGLIAAHRVGSGKTLTAVTATQCYLEDNPKGQVLIVTPVSLQENFKKEMRAYGVDPDSAKWKTKYTFFTLQGFANAYAGKACPSDAMLVIDEAHELRTEIKVPKRAKTSVGRTSRASVAVKCASQVKKVLLLTATTVYNTPYDIANLVAMVKGQIPPTKHTFEKTIMADPVKFKEFFSCVLSFYDIPQGEDYPEMNEHWMEIEMSPSYYKAYRDVEQQKSYLFSEKNPWRFLTGVRQASNTLHVCDKCKVILDRFKADPQKTVIYSAFLSFGVRKIQEMFSAAKIPWAEVTGSMKAQERVAAVKKYNSDQVQVLFISKAGSSGLNLRGTRFIYIFESSWNRPNEEQIIGRGVRYQSHSHLPKSERKVDVYHLIITKPKTGRDWNDKMESADEILRRKTTEKDKIGKEFLKSLFGLSIEQTKCP
jgi:SNF2 family DNA or RNA helicase